MKFTKLLPLLPLFGVLLFSCSGEKSKPQNNSVVAERPASSLRLSGGISIYKGSEPVEMDISVSKNVNSIESIKVYVNDSLFYATNEKKEKYIFSYTDSTGICGEKRVKSIVRFGDGKEEVQSLSFTIGSDITAENFTFNVIKEYPHDRDAYTQGLEFSGNDFFEGTGLNGHSQLRRVELSSGKVLQKIELEDQFFGEGITIMGDKIFQLTWQNKKGFIYNKKSFELEGEFSYDTQGWGICNDGEYLIYSDGSNKLFFLDATNYKLHHSIEVYDENGPVYQLNELEYYKGEIWANVYTTNLLVCIDPKTGKVRSRADLGGILKPEDAVGVDVLNGIAFDQKSGKLFVTGKKYPKLWQIELVKVNL